MPAKHKMYQLLSLEKLLQDYGCSVFQLLQTWTTGDKLIIKPLFKLKDKERSIFQLLNFFVVFIECLLFYFWLRNMCVACKIARGGGRGVREGLGMEKIIGFYTQNFLHLWKCKNSDFSDLMFSITFSLLWISIFNYAFPYQLKY